MPLSVLLVAVLFQSQADPGEALARFSTEFKSKDVDTRVAAVTELAQVRHERIHSKLGSLLLTDVREVRIAAAKGLGTAQDHWKKIVLYLTHGFLANQNDLAVEAAIIEALESVKEGSGRSTLENLIRSGDLEIAKTAVNTIGECRRKDLLALLVALYKGLDARAKEYQSAGPRARGYVGRGLPGDTGPTLDPEAPKRARTLGPVISQVLYSLTGIKLATSQEWDTWWQKNGADFKFP